MSNTTITVALIVMSGASLVLTGGGLIWSLRYLVGNRWWLFGTIAAALGLVEALYVVILLSLAHGR